MRVLAVRNRNLCEHDVDKWKASCYEGGFYRCGQWKTV